MLILLHASCLVDLTTDELKNTVLLLLTVLPMYSTHVTATGRSVLLHERKAVR